MGMMTRFRARLHSLHALTKLDPQVQAEKTAQTVCLLSVVLLLPYFARGHASVLVGGVGLGYSCLVLPMVISANYKYPVSALRSFAIKVKERCCLATRPALNLLWYLYSPIDAIERAYIKMSNIFTMVNQLIFFMLCNCVFVPTQRVTSLYSLMFYNVLAYCVSYIKELIEKEDWSPWVRMTEHSNLKHLAMSATKIVLEWTKAVTFIVTVVFMLLVFGLEQGLEHYRPTTIYTLFTWTYYAVTEKVFVELLLAFVTYLQLPVLENLESLWVPVAIRTFTASISFIFLLPLFFFQQYYIALISLYLNVYLRYKEMKLNCLHDLNIERAVLTQYRYATKQELIEFDDVCAVCLCQMHLARITPCHHIFHGECLRQCLKTSNQCPICKRELKFD